MTEKKKKLYVYDLVPGMVVANDIKSNGKVLIGKGVTVTEYAIKKLKEHYIFNKIEVYYEEDDEETENSEREKTKTVEQIEERFNELTFDVEKVLENVDNLRISGIDEVRRFAAKIQGELKSTSSVVKNIVLYGSGSDTIYRHGVNVTALSTILGKWIGLSGSQLNLLTYAAILHDIGKTKIDKNILDKPDRLTSKEYNEVKMHPTIGYNLIKEVPFLDISVCYGVLMHHERCDGSGYPLGLTGDKIHQFAKIIAIADVFDAVNSDRGYKKSKGPFEALEIIKKESLGRLDYEYCNVFLNHVVNYYMGENVMLNTKKICKIIQVDVNDLARPLLLDDTGFIDLKQHKDLVVEKLVL
ncbi:HD-GYP domain-containing protein [Clostridium thermarum]|uniref:HD-GYP domain-containing protein n=1 Tax=Clostridium thermarum TaxID=1716543 RepID=UPI0013D260F5|nr:HD-GYP domain-containing protein [Clostridium thermarum]